MNSRSSSGLTWKLVGLPFTLQHPNSDQKFKMEKRLLLDEWSWFTLWWTIFMHQDLKVVSSKWRIIEMSWACPIQIQSQAKMIWYAEVTKVTSVHIWYSTNNNDNVSKFEEDCEIRVYLTSSSKVAVVFSRVSASHFCA